MDPETPAPDAVDADTKLANMVNAAVGSQLKRTLGSTLEAALAPFREQLAGLTAPKAPDAPAARQEGTAKGGVDPDVARQLNDLQTQLKTEREARKAERTATLHEKAFSALRAELTGKVRPEAIEGAAKLFFHADKRVVVGEDGTASIRLGDEEHDLKTGVARLLKLPEHNFLLPAPGAEKKNPPKAPQRPGGAPPRDGQREDPLAKTLRDLGHD